MNRAIIYILNTANSPEREQAINRTVTNYQSYFSRSYGGQWEPKEIFFLVEPTYDDIQELLQNSETYDYYVLIFCLPIQTNEKTYQLQLNAEEHVPLQEIIDKLTKGLCIFENFTKVEEILPAEELQKLDMYSESNYAFALNPFECGRLYDIKNKEEFVGEVNSIQSVALPVSPLWGSLLSLFLLKTARLLVKTRYLETDFTSNFGFTTIFEILETTIKNMENYNLDIKDIKISSRKEEESLSQFVFTIIA